MSLPLQWYTAKAKRATLTNSRVFCLFQMKLGSVQNILALWYDVATNSEDQNSGGYFSHAWFQVLNFPAKLPHEIFNLKIVQISGLSSFNNTFLTNRY